jgi:ureidoacrylate peracid hydrolase
MTDDHRNVLRARIAPASTALIAIDVQNDFCAKGGYFNTTGADLSRIVSAAHRLVDFVEAARAASVLVVFVRSHYDPIYLSEAQNARRRRVGRLVPLCLQGSWGAEFFALKPVSGEPIVTKHRYDGFYNTDLELILRSNGIENVLMTGVATNTCVETTLRSAFVRDFEVTLVDDCAGARTQRAHDGTLDNVRSGFGVVAGADEIEREWRQLHAGKRAVAVT